jgi:hypothetical protein
MKPLYGLGNLFQKQPITIATSIVAWLNVFVIAGAITFSAETVSALNIALVATLGLFVSSQTTNTSVLTELAANGTVDGVPLLAKKAR